MGLRYVAADAELADIVAVLEADGGLVVEGLVPQDVIAELRAAIVHAAQSFTPGAATQGLGEHGKAFVGANTVRFSSLGKISPAFFRLLDNP